MINHMKCFQMAVKLGFTSVIGALHTHTVEKVSWNRGLFDWALQDGEKSYIWI